MAGRQDLFPTVTTEGGLLPSEVLARIAAGDRTLPGLRPEDYHLASGERLGEMINRSWNRLVGAWMGFREALSRQPSGDAATGLTRERWLLVLFSELGYGRLQLAEPVTISGATYPVSHAWAGIPIHLVGARVDLDRRTAGVAGAARRSPHSLVQELLNRSPERLWGLVGNGLKLRLLRDNATLTRQAFVEFDLAAMMDGEIYSDFALLWLVCHESRFAGDPQESWLESWKAEADVRGTRALDHLRDAVEEAILAFGSGFLSQTANEELRKALHSGELTPRDYYRLVLRLVYRLLFLFVAEDRDLLHPNETTPAVRDLYHRWYSVDRLRSLAERKRYSAHHDLYESLKVVMAALDESGLQGIGLPGLGSFIWAQDAIGTLGRSRISNRDLLMGVRALAFIRQQGTRRLVDYRNLGPEELGSVYESLLQLHPEVHLEAGRFELATVAGSERKSTGSYYTPTSLISSLLDTTIQPLLEEAAAKPNAESAILGLRVLDPACGSGHFLLAAADRIAKRLASVRTGDEEPSPHSMRLAMRDVVAHCVFGVDRNEMAVELCKVSLWLASLEPGKPLAFLDHHVVLGDSLLGTTPSLLSAGLPDEAFVAVERDDKSWAASLRNRNRDERGGQTTLSLGATRDTALARAVTEIDSGADESVAEVKAKERRYHALEEAQEQRRMRLAADAWCASFFIPKRPGFPVITDGVIHALSDGSAEVDPAVIDAVARLRDEYRFHHWWSVFPQVFLTSPDSPTGWEGGFDVVLGNPPWETLSPDRKEFFATYEPKVRFLGKSDQDAVVEHLLEEPEIANRWKDYQERLYRTVHFMKSSGRYRLFAPGNLGKGDFNVYRMFVETSMLLVRPGGYVAQILPAGFYGGANAMAIRRELYDKWQLNRVLGFINTAEGWFNGVDATTRFCAYSARKGGKTEVIEVAFELRGPQDLARVVQNGFVRMPIEAIRQQSPVALAIPETTSAGDAGVVERMYAKWPKFGDEVAGPPLRYYQREIDMGTDRDLFHDLPEGLPLYEGRMIDQYDHRAKAWRSGRGRAAVWEELRFGDPRKAIVPQWRVPRDKLPAKLGDRINRYRIGFGDVTAPRNERSLVAALIPPGAVCGHKVPTITFEDGWEWAYMPWLAVANSFAVDFLLRKKVALTVSYTVLDSIPFPRLPVDHPLFARLGSLALSLTCTAQEMTAYWNSMSAYGWCKRVEPRSIPPGLVDDNDRASARALIDVIVARDLFQLTSDEIAGILETFPVLKRNEQRRYGEFRTRRLVLDAYESTSSITEAAAG
jgi:hypothetical protein